MMSILQTQDFSDELGKLGGEQKLQEQRSDTDLGVLRSGSAPPTVEGSLSSINGLFGGSDFLGNKKRSENGGFVSEDDVRADPACVNYYYSNGNVNPKLPPPFLSREDWRFAQRNSSLFALHPVFDGGKEEIGGGGGGGWGGDGLIGLPGLRGLGSDQQSIAEMIQDNMNQTTGVSRHVPRLTCHNAFGVRVESSEPEFSDMRHDLASANYLQPSANKPGIPNVGSSSSYTYASALGASLSRNATPDSNRINGMSESLAESDELASKFFGLNLSRNGGLQKDNLSWSHPRDEMDDLHNVFDLQGKGSRVVRKMNNSCLMDERLIEPNKSTFLDPNYYLRGPYKYSYNHDADALDSPVSSYAPNGFAVNPLSPPMVVSQHGTCKLPPLYKNAAGSLALGSDLMGAAPELQNLNRMTNQGARNSLRTPLVDPSVKYTRSNRFATSQVTALNEAAFERDYVGGSYFERAYVEALIAQRKTQFGFPHLGKSGSDYYGDPTFGLGAAYQSTRFSPGSGNSYTGFVGPWNVESEGNLDESLVSSFLDEFKSNRTRSLELSEIAGHIVEFSADQYGSRFIQQKLETATVEEKNMVFDEIMPKALSLMTDVFGNYVVQKFLEHGTRTQIRALAEKLSDNVLALSLQMYGCRVIQKAIEVVELNQKTEMVKELDGHVMRCVRDQNGNHVIQKCIECVPEDAIQFIISTFYDHVFTLSTHPYGCRVIQRVLEHCHEEKTQRIMMDEILLSVCKLAQDQYGNYVVQHVLEHGKPHERSAIIAKLTGQIVQMSQQKFASNVVEKCLTFGTSTERKSLVNEMLGSTDENEPLQVMMKDQFGNYVVQKVLETCDDQHLQLILNRIKLHLNALKKYTYGKHIVARVEKLVAAGERRISILGLNSS